MRGTEEVSSLVIFGLRFERIMTDFGLNKRFNYSVKLENGALLNVTVS